MNNTIPNTLSYIEEEKIWCHSKFLDIKVLISTAQMIFDIKNRFYKLGFSKEIINSSLQNVNEDVDFFLKICIGGAFYGKYVRADFKN